MKELLEMLEIGDEKLIPNLTKITFNRKYSCDINPYLVFIKGTAKDLKILDVSDCHIFWENLAVFPRIEEFYARNCMEPYGRNLQDYYPQEVSFPNWTNITPLFINSISRFSSLKILDLSFCRKNYKYISGDSRITADDLDYMPRYRDRVGEIVNEYKYAQTKIESLKQFEGLDNLTHLYLKGQEVKDLELLADRKFIPNLKVLDLTENPWDKYPKDLISKIENRGIKIIN
jgi:Leucine-rich repeat (LRR) protein